MAKQGRIVVIGAGPAGIGAGLALAEQATVLDSRREIGGLCGTIHLDGCAFDLGGHSFHTPHPWLRELVFNSLDMYEQRRDARCYSQGVMISYPFQAHFRDIGSPRITRECLAGLADAHRGQVASNFEEFILQRFGAGIARHFLLPYNRKLWGTDLQRLAVDWASQRVAAPQAAREKFAVSGGERKPLQSDTTVAYPARGGFGEIMVALARDLADLQLAQTVVRVDCRRRQVLLASGDVVHWRQLVSTIPIDQLLKLLSSVPASLAADASRLEVLPLTLLLVVIGNPVDTPIQRIYCADAAMPAHKIALNHNSSPDLRGLPHHGIIAEISNASGKALSKCDLEQQVIRALQEMQVIKSRDDVRTTRIVEVPYAYPVPTHDRDVIVRRLKSWLREQGVHTLGRFGEWAYINSDEALYRGMTLGKTLAGA